MGTPVNFTENTEGKKPEWCVLYQELKEYIEQHPDIEIQDKIINIPRAKQSTFYQLFDGIRDAYITEEFSEILDQAAILSNSYLRTEQEFMKNLGLEDVLMPNDLKRFLHEPLNQLRREVFDSLFDLFCGKIDSQEFILETSLNLNQSFRQLCREGYKKWVSLALLNQFEPDQLYCVPLNKLGSKQVIKHPVMAKESLPVPVKTKILTFEVGHRQSLLVPDAIIHSSRYNKYVSFRSNFIRALWNSNSHSPRREWYSIQSLIEKYGTITIRPDLLIYIDDKLEDVSLVADNDRICRPDLIIGCIYELNADEEQLKDKVMETKSSSQVLNPTNGSYIISRQKLPRNVPDSAESGINFLEAELDEEKLNTIVKAIKK